MTTLIFKNEKLQGILKITQQATTFKTTLGEAIAAFKKDTDKKYETNIDLDKYLEHNTPTLWLVKDEGIYLMTSAKLNEIPKDKSHICYAEGFEPNLPDSWEKCEEAIGGGDFEESLKFTDQFQKAIMNGADIQIDISPSKFIVYLVIHR